jgi:rod shape-determining protein MreB
VGHADEAKAAAIGAGLPIAEPLASMVCDIGGGTTEVAVMSLADDVAEPLSVRVGGDAHGPAIVDYLRRHYSSADRPARRRAAADRHRQRLPAGRGTGRRGQRRVDTVSGLPRKATITSEEIRQALADPLGSDRRGDQAPRWTTAAVPTWPPT